MLKCKFGILFKVSITNKIIFKASPNLKYKLQHVLIEIE